ncbi:MAG: hypothetical protein ACXVXU_20710 [Blastococcus sp.]
MTHPLARRLALLALLPTLTPLAAGAAATPGNGWSGPVVLNDAATVPGWYAAMDATAAGDAVAAWDDRSGAGYVARRPSGGSWSAPAPVPDLGSVAMLAARADGTTLVATAGDGAVLETLLPDGSVVPALLGASGSTAYAKVDPVDDGAVGVVQQPGRIVAGYAAGGDRPGTWRSTRAYDVPHLASVATSAADSSLVATDGRGPGGRVLRVDVVDGLTGQVATAARVRSPGPVVWFRVASDPEGRAVLAWVWSGDGHQRLTVRRLTTYPDHGVVGPATRLADHRARGVDPGGQPLVLVGPRGRATVVWSTATARSGHRVLRAAEGGPAGRWAAPTVLDPDVAVSGELPMQLTADTVPATGAALVTYVDAESLVAVHRSTTGGGFAPAQRLFHDYSRGTSSAYGVSAVAADGRAWVLKVAVDGLVKVRERPAG